MLDVGALHLPDCPRVQRIVVEEFEDSTGDDSLNIYAILDDATTDADRNWAHLKPIDQEIRRVLRDAGEERFPYITAGTKQEFDRRYSYDPSSDE